MALPPRSDVAPLTARVGDSHTHRYGSYLLDLTRKSHYASSGHVPGRTEEERAVLLPMALARRRDDAARMVQRRMEREEEEVEREE